jgi:hypothetical protein
MCVHCGNGYRFWDAHPSNAVANDPGMLEELGDRMTWVPYAEIVRSPGWHLWHRRGGVDVRPRP